MAVTLMLFVRLPKAHTSARVKQALKEMENTVKVICLLFVAAVCLFHIHICSPKPRHCQSMSTAFVYLASYFEKVVC